MPKDSNVPQKFRYVPNKKKMEELLSTPNSKLPAGAKLVFLNLMHRLGGKRTCWPSQERIAKDVGFSSRQVRNHLRRLEKIGAIVQSQRGFKDTRLHRQNTRSSEYDLGNMLVLKNLDDKSKKSAIGTLLLPKLEINNLETGKEVPTNDK